MFKDARLQERIFDQIHAVEFNMEDDFRSAEVGSLLSAGFGSDSFERDRRWRAPKRNRFDEERRPREAHVSSFVDDVADDTLRSGGFQRISDDEEEAIATETESQKPASRKRAQIPPPQVVRKRNAQRKQPRQRRAALRKRKPRVRSLRRNGQAVKATRKTAENPAGYGDSEARVGEGQSRGEFATRRGGRRRRRPGKNRPPAAARSRE